MDYGKPTTGITDGTLTDGLTAVVREYSREFDDPRTAALRLAEMITAAMNRGATCHAVDIILSIAKI